MCSKNQISGLAAGLVVGAAAGTLVGILFAPEPGSEAREMVKDRLNFLAAPCKKLLFDLKWMTMSPREKYSYFWAHGGSLHDWRAEHEAQMPPRC